jgi:hypothetical protein
MPGNGRGSTDHSRRAEQPAKAGEESLLVEPKAMGGRGRLAPSGHAEFGKDVGDVDAGGLFGDEELLADLPVGLPLGQQGEHLGLAAGQAKGGRRSVAAAPPPA